jgi:methyl-accepting chemotaxis protein
MTSNNAFSRPFALSERVSVSARLSIAFGMMIAMLIAGAGLGLYSIAVLHDMIDAQATSGTPSLVLAARWQQTVLLNTRHMRDALITGDQQQAAAHIDAVRAGRQQLGQVESELARRVADGPGRSLLQDVRRAAQAYAVAEDEFVRAGGSGQADQAKLVLAEKVAPAEAAYVTALERFESHVADASASWALDASVTYERSRVVMFMLSLLAILLATTVAGLFSRRLRLQLGGEPGYAMRVASSIATGDLSIQVEVRPGDTSSLLYAMGRMAQSLRQLVGEVASGARVVADTSQQIAQGNVDLSQRTEEQACTLEETASSMEQLTGTVLQNADGARKANELAAGASEVALKGGAVVGQVVSTMTAISDSSRRIGDIIAVIDSIAFQTNILALNASVEAARAGEQGRGFAVVAAEVRNLAQRSAAAAREIKTLIGNSVETVDAGSRLVGAAGRTMDEIVEAVKGVTALIAEIAAASQEQSTGIEQVNRAVSQMEQVVQQNASLVEEATAATESMKDQAGALLRSVSRFKLDETSAVELQPLETPRFEAQRVETPRAGSLRARAGTKPRIATPWKDTTPRQADAEAVRAPAAAGDGHWQEF